MYPLMARCPCGAELTTSAYPYSYVQYENGEIVYAICIHGIVVIDKINQKLKDIEPHVNSNWGQTSYKGELNWIR